MVAPAEWVESAGAEVVIQTVAVVVGRWLECNSDTGAVDVHCADCRQRCGWMMAAVPVTLDVGADEVSGFVFIGCCMSARCLLGRIFSIAWVRTMTGIAVADRRVKSRGSSLAGVICGSGGRTSLVVTSRPLSAVDSSASTWGRGGSPMPRVPSGGDAVWVL